MILWLFFQMIFVHQEITYSKKQYDGYTLYYAIENQAAAFYFTGFIVENKSKSFVSDANIYEQGSLEGTVPNPRDGKFKLRLQKKRGKIVFQKVGEFKFLHAFSVD